MLVWLCAAPVFGQAPAVSSDNPLAALKEDVARALGTGGVPFTPEQEVAIVLMMEERRRASEDLFGGLLDFTNGPTQGQEADRLRSAIEWMRGEFLRRLQDYLTEPQLAAWERHTTAAQQQSAVAAPRRPQQTQYVRINNNAFTAEDMVYRFGQGGGGQAGTEVIQRGGAGAFHGNAQFLLQDEALNARNPFAANKPPYQERRTSMDISGPVIPGRLTTTFLVNQTEAENVDTVNALTPTGPFALGITRPSLTRSFEGRNIYQLADAHSVSFSLRYGSTRNQNQNVGGFTVPERASESRSRTWNAELAQFSTFSTRMLYETRFTLSASHSETMPQTAATRVNVLDAFNSGGAQNEARSDSRSYQASNLFTRFGEMLTLKAGALAIYRDLASFSRANFDGTFTFSSLDAFLTGRPVNYRVNRGIPDVDTTQW